MNIPEISLPNVSKNQLIEYVLNSMSITEAKCAEECGSCCFDC